MAYSAQHAGESAGLDVGYRCGRATWTRCSVGSQVDGGSVAFAVASNPVHGMSRIGPVYTLPHFRGNGYGTAVTAAASTWALNAGAKHVVLFTDLANRVSNSIYQKIGYRSVLDAVEYESES